MQTKRPLSLVTKTTQKQNNTNEFFKLERNNTRKTNKNKHINHKNQTTLLTNRAQKKTPELQGKQLFHRLKAKQERRIKTKTQNKTKEKHQKQSQHNDKKTERLKHIE